ncbi:hypothetical protein [Undibacterium sp.]|uniref:hypothetical protein n=1 Tax=Undibacterium sp. TaxID=1914977 RepID=UPI0025D64827|nr:hypothetical protein [Undibacterium sp.]
MEFQMQAAPLRIFHALLQAHWPASRMGYACWRHAVFALLRLGLVCTSVVVVRLLAGGRPAATPFSCFAKKSKQKKAPQSRCPSGSRLCRSKNGKSSKLATLKHEPF